MVERLPPSSIEAEEAVLGGCLLDMDAVVQVARILTPEMFYREKNGVIFQAIRELYDHGEPVDLITLGNLLASKGKLEHVGGQDYLTGLLTVVPTATHAAYYADIVRQKWLKRQLISAAGKMAALGYNEETEVSDDLQQVRQMIVGLTNYDVNLEAMRDRVRELREYYEERKRRGIPLGMPTGYQALDNMVEIKGGNTIVVAGLTSMGKSAFAMSLVKRVCSQGMGVCYISPEMSWQDLTVRITSMVSGLPTEHYKHRGFTAEETRIIEETEKLISDWNLFIDDRGTHTLGTIADTLGTAVLQHRVNLAVVDYIQLLGTQSGEANRVQELAMYSRGLRQLSKDLDVPIVVLSQLNRGIAARDLDSQGLLEYKNSDLRESGAIEQDADVITFIDRPHRYNPKKFKVERGRDGQIYEPARLIVTKNRSGKVGEIPLWFHPPTTEFIPGDALHQTTKEEDIE